ncbi:MAG: hypothetical protein GFH27_549283n341 [Chloroflexi bacterium AL-W]|nr:hypothetical protein [Chloroflexi bacterium AL-N1]NOK64537.1 hypothetical protein [Chloroflexi bacterium AL-N10]NOK75779.1 hypothetical protein [Chloroflexi bacterium AL-N5]NOK80462.1 hypothetical protein [Chloroflexi bacterium AL-W]NOK86976.1 hypothetical protein [Chloroflexi bacterium AL-N15]
MPNIRKLTSEEIRVIERRIKGQRKLIEEEYDALLGDYSDGDYGEAELSEGENRITVRNRLKAAANRRNLSLDFKRTKGNILRFRVISKSNGEARDLQEVDTPTPAPRSGRPKKKV